MKNKDSVNVVTDRKIKTNILPLTPEDRIRAFANLIIDRILEDYPAKFSGPLTIEAEDEMHG